MTDTPAVPEWITTEIRYWLDIFNLEAWKVDVVLNRIVNDNSDVMGCCVRNANYNRATLHLRSDIEDTEEWRKVILHECLHIVMARVDTYVCDAMLPELPPALHGLSGAVYVQHVESFVQMLTVSFWRFYREQMERETKKRTKK